MKLRVFDKADYDTLIHWIDSEKLNYQWGGPNFGLTIRPPSTQQPLR